jgi:TetR/AcrR family transcriptional regulator, regulator of cefoperazone and chloramphenicol sensitivity
VRIRVQRVEPCGALTALLTIIDRFVEVMMHLESAAWARLIVREQREPTEAFDILYGGLMGRRVDPLAALIVRIGGRRWDTAEARLKTVAFVGQARVFRVVRAHTIATFTSGYGDLAP